MWWMTAALLVVLLLSALIAAALLLSYLHLSSRSRSQPWLPWPSTASLAHHSPHTSHTAHTSLAASPSLPVVGLVIAHPDDESMFFLPTLLHLLSIPSLPTPHLLCLSTGNAEHLGAARIDELLRATSLLSIPPSHVLIVDDERLQDSMTSSWPLRVVQDKVGEWVRRRRVEQLITFDQGGVSGHPNHRAVHHAVSEWIYAHAVPAWELVSWPLWRKYASIIGGWGAAGEWSGGRGRGGGRVGRVDELLLVHWDGRVNWRCMRAHRSQWLWYRRLFVVFSLYTYVNVLRRM